MTITLARVDDRVIHGQTTTRWTKARSVQGILVVGDDIANDDLRKRVLKAAAGNLKLGVYTTEQAVESIPKGKNSDKDFFLISNSPQTFAKLVELGVDFGRKLNVGPMNTREGAKVLGRTVAIDGKDYEAFEYLEKNGIEIGFQLLPDDEAKPWKVMKDKFDSMT
ncbi:PTS sugar transporter subunit IIB [Enterococcus sp. BWB1-3]|uniref:PTS system mannose/fructose/N-acetylgalactosamine-transporter subunit IIB n=1 Tax=unclassified Enterococcus TaxID=2608891 RepID=UPI001921E1B7|nr:MULTISPECIES: PTS sugar transporter subunit IIB [unclassified Enterococcus]MBL1229675.1 PTS sugar transporter subunit IIB [Enterococcus sp. BWB1-3]MCB5953813.1 PTS sugar transporter subunit IIB [Enterococcus sp. CWB-B31]